MAEFTGERVIPGKVDIDLWNEHVARYHFAARLARHKKVIDLGCGTGYGTAELSETAESVVGVDVSDDAILEARQEFTRPNLSFQTASVTELPFPDANFHLGVCFEVIEHLDDYRPLLAEARRVLVPGGQFIVSTPNSLYYAESRKLHGPNPYHTREFTFAEFRAALAEYFDHQTLFVQNHTAGIAFLPLENQAGTELRVSGSAPRADDAHFFLAVCAARQMMGSPAYFFVPASANVLKEREHHIARLEGELHTKNEWLTGARNELATMVTQFRQLQKEMEAKNEWALERDRKVKEAAALIEKLEAEQLEQIAQAAKVVAAYEEKLRAGEREAAETQEWIASRERQANEQMEELSRHIAKLDQDLVDAAGKVAAYQKQLDEAEATVIERTQWAQHEQTARESAEARLNAIDASRWTKLGKAFGLGPKFS
jgi:2-polyprenyl-3-methyl-5-hydroxy-6-metoxy-1,4-benzoquinol methylase